MPLLLQLLELVIVLVGVIRRLNQFFKFLDDGQLHLIVLFALFLLLGIQLASLLFDNGHHFLEYIFICIWRWNEILFVASTFNKGAFGRLHLAIVESVEILLQ